MKSILFKLTESEKNKIREEAEKTSIPVATYCRMIILREVNKIKNQEDSQ